MKIETTVGEKVSFMLIRVQIVFVSLDHISVLSSSMQDKNRLCHTTWHLHFPSVFLIKIVKEAYIVENRQSVYCFHRIPSTTYC